ncbi:MAG: site-specific integrase [Pirellulales bacterium]|nr:site-specific integrase [Pirellulales bacterium]
MQVSLETDLHAYYGDSYRPQRHASPDQKATRANATTQINNYNSALRYRQAAAGQRLRNATLADLTDDNLAAAMAWLLECNRAATTANKLYRTIVAIWNHAIERDLIAKPTKIKKLREHKRKPIAWSVDEYRRLVETGARCSGSIGKIAEKLWWPAFLRVAFNTAGRKNVLLQTPTGNFEAIRGEILLPAKHQKHRTDHLIELHPETTEALIALQSRDRGLDRLFGDAPTSELHFNNRLRQLIVDAGLRKDRKSVTRDDLTHKIRRTALTQIAAVHGLEAAQKFAGHSHASVTLRYIDDRFMPDKSARLIVPQLRLISDDPPADPDDPPMRIYRPEAG